MAAFRLLLCTVVASVCFCSLINAAVVHNLIHASELAGDRAEESYITFPDSIRTRRSIDSEGSQASSAKVCTTGPCGWAVYVPFTRRVDYFMKNTCDCPSATKCIRTDDDLSVSAYVYRCRNNVTAADIESPNENNSN